MATYDGNNLTGSESFTIGDIINFAYIGSSRAITLSSGFLYSFECYGARGGNYGGTGGLGGHAYGNISLFNDTTFYVYVGGVGGGGANNSTGGWNGGGSSANQIVLVQVVVELLI